MRQLQPIRRAAVHARQMLRVMLAMSMGLALAACSSVGVKPWERDLMAKPEMTLDAGAIDASMDDHVYFSKEAASGGKGFGGGGCGCN